MLVQDWSKQGGSSGKFQTYIWEVPELNLDLETTNLD